MHRKRTVAAAVRSVLVGIGALGLVLAGTASASATTHHVDVKAGLALSDTRVAPGRQLLVDVSASAAHKRGYLPHFWAVLHLPRGFRYVPTKDTAWAHCTSTRDRRTVYCPAQRSGTIDYAGAQLTVAVSKSVHNGTTATLTATTLLRGAVDPNPANNTARAKVLVKAGQDVGVRWIAPSAPVRAGGAPVVTKVVVTNHGRHRTTPRLYFDLTRSDIYRPGFQNVGPLPAGCESDSGEWDCYFSSPLLPGQSKVFTFTWKIAPVAAGRTLRIPAYVTAPYDPDPRNDVAVLVLRVAR